METRSFSKTVEKVFKISILASLLLHGISVGGFYISQMQNSATMDSADLSPVEIDLDDFPPELLGGAESPAPVEKQDWVEGSKKDGEDPNNDDLDPNKVSGDGKDKDGFLYSYNGDRPPTPILDFDPNSYFPDAAKNSGITEKTVVVLVQVDESGTLRSAKVVSGNPGYGFDSAALKIIHLARFSPGYSQGKPTSMSHRVPIHFRLGD
ncbi:energy transducer TonB [Leptospira sarikeiensis]|uniref:Energy transducer TonB n=1 Tax=Leptospira sarikeiensis TaxID=2484943 RepID=A0A4R9K4S8_9LEPT|nr:energy transducer TonB [Leptospira sarikeiensis]TGL60483.1 energy transducer TonB [Leptospira sarikeiensis]